jgi:hypothetical protein
MLFGHQLGAGQVLVGHQACLGHGGGPPLSTHCTILDGPAVVRISNRSR